MTLKEILKDKGYSVKDLHERVNRLRPISYKVLWKYTNCSDRSSYDPQMWLVIDEALKDMGVRF